MLNLNSNSFSGRILAEFGKLTKNMTILDLGNNELLGIAGNCAISELYILLWTCLMLWLLYLLCHGGWVKMAWEPVEQLAIFEIGSYFTAVEADTVFCCTSGK